MYAMTNILSFLLMVSAWRGSLCDLIEMGICFWNVWVTISKVPGHCMIRREKVTTHSTGRQAYILYGRLIYIVIFVGGKPMTEPVDHYYLVDFSPIPCDPGWLGYGEILESSVKFLMQITLLLTVCVLCCCVGLEMSKWQELSGREKLAGHRLQHFQMYE